MKNNYFAKIIRTLASFLPVAKNRAGKCIKCGACCRLPKPCVFLKEKDGEAYCKIYKFRPLNCRKYPRTEKEFLTKDSCGYRFSK